MVYSSQRLDAKPVESCVSVRRADPRCFLRRINSCRAAAAEGEGGGVEEGSGAELSPVPPLLFRISQSVRLPPSLAPQSVASAVRRALLRCFLQLSLRPSSSQNSFAKQEERHRHKMEKSEAAEARRE